MLDHEPFFGTSKVPVLLLRRRHVVPKGLVYLITRTGVHPFAAVVQHQKDPGRPLVLDQLTHHFIVEELHLLPLDAFAHVLLLFGFER